MSLVLSKNGSTCRFLASMETITSNLVWSFWVSEAYYLYRFAKDGFDKEPDIRIINYALSGKTIVRRLRDTLIAGVLESLAEILHSDESSAISHCQIALHPQINVQAPKLCRISQSIPYRKSFANMKTKNENQNLRIFGFSLIK
jgi:hypothetical protein